MPELYNLSALASALGRGGRHVALVSQIDAQRDTASRMTDLSHAVELVAQLAEVHSTPGRLFQSGVLWDAFSNVQGALFAQALILYGRATERPDPKRPLCFDLEAVVTSDELAAHRRLRTVRDRAIAHVDSEARQDWHTNVLVLLMGDDGTWRFRAPHNRTSYNTATFRDLQTSLETALKAGAAFGHRALLALGAALDAALKEDPRLKAVLENCVFDAQGYFGTSAEATSAIAAMLRDDEGMVVWNTQVSKPPTMGA